MLSPSYCTRCSRLLAVESASGLCLECLRTVNTPGSTSQNPSSPSPVVNARATTLLIAEPSDRTRANGLLAEPTTASGIPKVQQAPLPASPPGYELIRELGIGGMGAVYLAQEVVSERKVALKFLQRPGHQGAFDRFGVEVKAFGALDHPNIIRFYSSDFLRSNPYFTSEYAPGGCLLKKLETEGPLDPKEAARLIAIVARAIHAAHSARVIHRDLKPSNIVLTADGLPKVSDFGLAKRLDREDDLTEGSGPLGSPPYMAPEQTGRNEGAIDARTDVYGLGATLYHLVTGRRPFMGLQDEVIRQVKSDPPIPPRSLRREVPRELEAISLKCLEKEPFRRYQTAEALAADLDKFLVADENITAPLLTWPRSVGQRLRRSQKRIAVSVLIVLGMVAVAAAAIALTQPAPVLPPEPPLDPLAEIQRKLRAGEEVELIGATGLPKYYRWRLGGGEFGTCPTGEKTCYYESVGYSLLELVPNPGIDGYRLTLDIRHIGAAGGPPVGPDRSWLGPYLAEAESPTANGRSVHTLLGATYSDIHPNAARQVWNMFGWVLKPMHVVRFRGCNLPPP